jgi:hypothetical protein
MRAGLAAKSADRWMSGVVVAIAAALSAILVCVISLALSNPFTTAGHGDWIIQAAATPAQARQVAQVATAETPAPQPAPAQTIIVRSVATQRVVAPPPAPAPVKTRPATEKMAFAARWQLAGVTRAIGAAETTTGSVRLALADESTPVAAPNSPRAPAVAVPPEAARIKPAERKVEAEPVKKVNPLEEVDRYLWEVYQRAPVKKDSSGDFTWKDPAAAKRLHMSLKDYVIGGMEPDFREQLYHAGKALDAAGLQWSMLSAFRDDYRQALAAGFKARPGNSLHGGSRAVGGYGHGRAIDIMNIGGDDETVWHWLDAHGARYGLRRPMPGYDPAHIQAGGDWHRIAESMREGRLRAAAAKRPANEADAAAKTKNAKTAM